MSLEQRVSLDALEVGDKIRFGINHPNLKKVEWWEGVVYYTSKPMPGTSKAHHTVYVHTNPPGGPTEVQAGMDIYRVTPKPKTTEELFEELK